MQANCSQLHSSPQTAGGEDASVSQCVQTRLTGEASCLYSGDVHIQINTIPKECAENPSSRNVRSGVHSCTHGCVHSRLRSHSHNEARQPDDNDTESGDHGSSSFSEFRYLFKWLQKSLPYILILGVKLVMQHITGRVWWNIGCFIAKIQLIFFIANFNLCIWVSYFLLAFEIIFASFKFISLC